MKNSMTYIAQIIISNKLILQTPTKTLKSIQDFYIILIIIIQSFYISPCRGSPWITLPKRWPWTYLYQWYLEAGSVKVIRECLIDIAQNSLRDVLEEHPSDAVM